MAKLFDRIHACMGRTLDDPKVAALATALGRKPPTKDGHLVQKGVVELRFDRGVRNPRFPATKLGRTSRVYLSHAWLREGFADFPKPFRQDMTLAEMRRAYGDDFTACGFDEDRITSVRWKVVSDAPRQVVLLPTYWFEERMATLELGLDEESEYFEFIDPARGEETTVGWFIAYCAINKLLSPALTARAAADVAQVKKRKMTGRELVAKHIDRKDWDGQYNHVWSSDLHPDHRDFFYSYLHGLDHKEVWGKDDVGYRADLESVLGRTYKRVKDHPPDYRDVPDTWANYDAIAKILDGRRATWKKHRAERQVIVDRTIATDAKPVVLLVTAKRTGKRSSDPADALIDELDRAVKRFNKSDYEMSFVDGLAPAVIEQDRRGLPAALVKLWAWRNGQEDWDVNGILPGCGTYGVFLSYAASKKLTQKSGTGLESAWVPVLAGDTDGELVDGREWLCVDLAGSFGGQAGQVIRWSKKPGARRAILAPDLEAWLRVTIEAVKQRIQKFDTASEEKAFIASRVPGYPKPIKKT